MKQEAYPLQWPQGWPRTQNPERARFAEHPLVYAVEHLYEELEKLGGKDIVVSTNIPTKANGIPYARYKLPEDKGVAVYFKLNDKEQCFPCDRWDRVEHNIWAIMKSVEAIRGLERWGAKDMVDAAFRGFEALPHYNDKVNVKQVEDYFHACKDLEDVEITWKSKRRYLHPDNGGSVEEFQELTNQYKRAKENLKNE